MTQIKSPPPNNLLPILNQQPEASPEPLARDLAARWKRRSIYGVVLFLFATVPAVIGEFFVAAPQERRIHMEAFRYGKEPSVIRVNRGDTLRLTFSTRDTAHSFFLEEFDVDAKITPNSERVTVFRTSDPEATPKILDEITIKAEHPGWTKYFVSKSLYRCHVYCGPMHAFEHGNLIIWPNTLLLSGLGLLVGLPIVGLLSLRSPLGGAGAAPVGQTDGWDVFDRFPILKRLTKLREFQFVWLVFGAIALYIVLLTSLFGTNVAGRNLGVMMTWVVWIFLLTMILTPLGGRIWCMACPLPLLGDVIQRRRRGA